MSSLKYKEKNVTSLKSLANRLKRISNINLASIEVFVQHLTIKPCKIETLSVLSPHCHTHIHPRENQRTLVA